LDPATRALAVEVNMYNVNIGVFTTHQMLVLFHTGGRVEPVVHVFTCAMNSISGTTQFVVCLWTISALWVLIVVVLRDIVHQGLWGGLLSRSPTWRLLEMLNLGLIAGFLVCFWSYTTGIDELSINVNDSTFTTAIYSPGQYHRSGNVLLGFSFLITCMRAYKFFELSPHMHVMVNTFKIGVKDIAWFIGAFVVTMVAFATQGHIVFGSSLEGFSTVWKGILTCVRILLGDFDYDALKQASPFWAPVFFTIYMIFVAIMLLNMFIAIVCEFYSRARDMMVCKKLETTRRKISVPAYKYLPLTYTLRCAWRNILFGKTPPGLTPPSFRQRLVYVLQLLLGVRGPSLKPEKQMAWKNMRLAVQYAHMLGIDLEDILWSYLEAALNTDSGSEFLIQQAEFFAARWGNRGSKSQLIKPLDKLPYDICMTELAFLLEFKFMHPDLRRVATPWCEESYSKFRDEYQWRGFTDYNAPATWYNCNKYHSQDTTGYAPFGKQYVELAHILFTAGLQYSAIIEKQENEEALDDLEEGNASSSTSTLTSQRNVRLATFDQ